MNNVRLKAANKETVAAGWTYLDDATSLYTAIALYNKAKEEWNWSCVELRIETDTTPNSHGKYVRHVYIRKCLN